MQDSPVPPISKVGSPFHSDAMAIALAAILAPAVVVVLRDPQVRAAVAALLTTPESTSDLDETAAAKVVGATKTTFKRAN